MKTPTLTEIRKSVEAAGGDYKKASFYLNGEDAYTVNGRDMTKSVMILRYQRGEL